MHRVCLYIVPEVEEDEDYDEDEDSENSDNSENSDDSVSTVPWWMKGRNRTIRRQHKCVRNSVEEENILNVRNLRLVDEAQVNIQTKKYFFFLVKFLGKNADDLP